MNFDLAKVFFLCYKLLYLVLTISRKHKKSISQAVSTYHQNFRENAKVKAPLIVFLTFPLPDSCRPCSCACVKSIFSPSRCLLILGFSRYSLYIYCESFTKTRKSVDKVIYIYEYSLAKGIPSEKVKTKTPAWGDINASVHSYPSAFLSYKFQSFHQIRITLKDNLIFANPSQRPSTRLWLHKRENLQQNPHPN